MWLLTVGDKDVRLGVLDAIDFVVGFEDSYSRRKACKIMEEHRRDDENISDTENMLKALSASGIEFKVFYNIKEMWL